MNSNIKSINEPKDLAEILGADISDNVTKGNKYRIEKTLDCTELTEFIPLGSGSRHSFDGELDGNGYAITNLTMKPLKAYDLALFTKIGSTGIVKNLRVENVNIMQKLTKAETATTTTCAGAIAAVCQGEISGCSASGIITLQGKTDNCQVGGLCGSLSYTNSKISNSWANVCISLQAACGEKSNREINKAYSVGGVVGTSNGSIEACHSRSEIFPPGVGVTSYAVGGICGVSESDSKATSCYNIGYLHSRGAADDAIGGIVGSGGKAETFLKCYYLRQCPLSKNFEKHAKVTNSIGIEKEWEDLVDPKFALSDLGSDYVNTGEKEGYTYTPYLKVFDKTMMNTDYLGARCTPVAVSFTQGISSDSANPMEITCKLMNCGLNGVSVTAKKKDQSSDTINPTVSANSFRYNPGNNTYLSYEFVLTLKDKYERTIDICNVDVDSAAKLILPHIEEPTVSTGKRLSRLTVNTKESIRGFTDIPGVIADYNYDYCSHHWVGNSPGPTPTPTPKTFYAKFSATVSCAEHMTVKETKAVITEGAIDFTETGKKTKELEITRQQSAYDYTALIFTVKNKIGIEASTTWAKPKQAADPIKPDNPKIEDKWRYPLKRLTWSLTNRCNMKCRHCSSRDIHKNMTELSDSEIRSVVKDIIQLGVSEVSLSGGEILLSPHWNEPAETLSRAGIKVSLITNGTLIDSVTAAKIKSAGISRVSVSIDDLQEQKVMIRDKSSYPKAELGIKHLKEVHMPVSIITTVNARNINMLEEMRDAFTALEADAWCLKPILPMGEAARNQELWLDERDINRVIEFCYSAMSRPGLPVVPSLSFEMHSEKGAAVLRYLYGKDICTDFRGSDAGIFSAQLHPDGNLVGACMCSPAHSVGNVKERSLGDIWQDQSSFKALRQFNPALLEGYCGKCERRNTCRGGELNTRLAFGGIYAENKFCAYRNFKLYGITI